MSPLKTFVMLWDCIADFRGQSVFFYKRLGDAALPGCGHGLCGGFGRLPSSSASGCRPWRHGFGQPCLHTLLVRTADGRPLPTDNHKPITSRTWACYVHIFIIIIIRFIFVKLLLFAYVCACFCTGVNRDSCVYVCVFFYLLIFTLLFITYLHCLICSFIILQRML